MVLTKLRRRLGALLLSVPLLNGSALLAHGEQAVKANAFIDSIGINTRFNYTNTYYYNEWPLESQLLVELGVRHIRDGGPYMPQWYYDRINALHSSGGIRNIGNCPTVDDQAGCVQSMITSMPGLEGIESLNEYNVSGDPNWATTLQKYQSQLYKAVKSNPSAANLPIIGPSLANLPVQQAQQLGNLSSSLDFGDIHNYPCGRNPGTAGWGGPYNGHNYGGIGYNLAAESLIAGAKPVWTTETGYDWGTTPGGDTPDDINARYMPRVYLEQFRQGIRRTYMYQFSSQGPSAASGDGSGQLGLLDFSLNPKPAYYALKNLITILKDTNQTFSAGKLNYTIAGEASNVHHVLFQKHDGSFYIAIWIEAEGFDVNAYRYEIVPDQTVTLSLPSYVTAITTYAFDDTGNVSSAKEAVTGGAIKATISDKVQIFYVSAAGA